MISWHLWNFFNRAIEKEKELPREEEDRGWVCGRPQPGHQQNESSIYKHKAVIKAAVLNSL